MSNVKLSRRNFLRATAGIAGAAALAAGCKSGAPAVVKTTGEADLSKPENVKKALEAEGAVVNWTTWGFEGLGNQVLPARFALYTQQKYGIPVTLIKINQDIGKAMTELPVAGKHIRDLDIDVMDNEEEYYPRFMALEWGEPIDREQYKPLIPNVLKTEKAYIQHDSPKVDGGDIYGAMYQGFEWLQAILRKDKVDVKNYNDWTDLSRAELKGKGVLYPFNDSRGQFVFMGILNSLIKQGIVKGDLWSEAAWEAGIKWWKDNLEDKIWKWGDIGNNMDLRANLQAGEVWWAGTWGVYTRAILATDWNQKDNVIAGFYPKSGIAADREKCKVVKGCKHPVAARILSDWTVTNDFQHAGWYQDKPGGTDTNRWNITKAQYLALYCGGVMKEHREVMPEWAKSYYPPDPGSLILVVNWDWWSSRTEWISKTYDKIVKGA